MTNENEIAVLERALNSGHKSVQFNGRRVEYQDAAAIRARIKELRQQAGGGPTFGGVVQHVSRGGW